MIDFTNSIEEINSYKGSEKKKTLILNNKKYLVKFPDPIIKDNNLSFINNTYSEYIGSKIFEICNIKVQNTILGTYKYNNKLKIVCACEDFTNNNNKLYEFENIALSTNPEKRITTNLNDIFEVINESNIINTKETIERFWDMFIIDTLIGNTDRHNGNWGFLINTKTKTASFSPIYDNGSCLNPLLDDIDIEKLNETEIKNLAINTYSVLKENDKKINYISYIRSQKNKDCNEALLRIFNNINITKITEFINSIPYISDIRKNFYIKLLNIRYDILNTIYNKLK